MALLSLGNQGCPPESKTLSTPYVDNIRLRIVYKTNGFK